MGVFVDNSLRLELAAHLIVLVSWPLPISKCGAGSPIGAGQLWYRKSRTLHMAAGEPAGAEGGLKVVAADGTVQIEDLAGQVEAGA